MPHLITDSEYELARSHFEPTLPSGAARCQAFSRSRLKVAIGDGGGNSYKTNSLIDSPEEWADYQCSQPAQKWSTVCRYHGAGKKGGVRGGSFPVTARYSKALEGLSIKGAFEEALTDQGLIELTSEMALIVARISQLLSRTENMPDPEEMGDAIVSLGQAIRAQDMPTIHSEYLRLADIVNAASGEWSVWREIRLLIEQERKLASTDTIRREKLAQFMTAQQANALIVALGDIIKSADLPDNTKRDIIYQLIDLQQGNFGPYTPTANQG